MSKTFFKYIVSITLILFCSINNIHCQEYFHEKIISFENTDILKSINTTNSKASLSTSHFKDGKNSLEWSYKKNASLELNKNINFLPFDPKSGSQRIPNFSFWIYSEKAVDEKITVQFLTDEKVNCEFEFNINYTGWRAAWVAFERDMTGTPLTSMNKVRFVGPKNHNGKLFIDKTMLCSPADSRWNTPDYQVPFVNKETKNHWLILYKSSLNRASKPLPKFENKHSLDFKDIETRYEEIINYDKNPKSFSEIKKEFKSYNIKRENGNIVGDVMWFCRYSELYRPFFKGYKNYYKKNSLRNYLLFMHNIAYRYNKTKNKKQKEILENMFFDLSDNMIDQGWTEGSASGTLHHLGYSMRKYYSAYFLMREPMRRTHRLAEVQRSMVWFSGVKEIFAPIHKKGMSIDAFNTSVMGRLASILLLKDTPEKVQYLNYYLAWINNGLACADGLYDSFKVDGSVFHHGNNYPAYADGGYDGATRMVYFFHHTSFAVNQQGHLNLNNSLLKTRLFCNKETWPLSMSGRHPKGKGSLSAKHYKLMMLSGSANRKDSIDKEMAAAYLRLMKGKKKDATDKKIIKAGYKAEKNPNGNWSMNYAALAIHRRGAWSATAQGHSRYLWAAEHYIGANYYGRYLKHGSLEIKSGKEKTGQLTSGFNTQGWDWARIPGTTTIHLPIDDLEANILNIDKFTGFEEMLMSDEFFAGAINLENKNGAWAMKLHEHDKYNGSHRANKSVFFFDNIIVCLGSDIENINTDYNTETTLFQNFLTSKTEKLVVNTQKISRFPYSFDSKSKSATTIYDNQNNGFYIPAKYKVEIRKQLQHSKDQKKKTYNNGNFTSAVISHAKAPKNGEYQYAILVQRPLSKFNDFIVKMNNKETAPYTVLKQDKNAHIVTYNKNNTSAFVLFQAQGNINIKSLKSVSKACLIMMRDTENKKIMSLCNPDLSLYEGPADVVIENGKRKERSIYSRDWFYNKSKESKVIVEIEGQWKLEKNAFCKLIKSDKNASTLEFSCIDGLTREITLTK